MILISIVIPTYNRVSPLRRCIESILKQPCNAIEVIIIDDDSTDITKLYLQELIQYSFIKFLYNRENRGVNYSRNRGIEAASGSYILFLDSDDELMDDSLSSIKKSITRYPETKHFLFINSDRMTEFKHITTVKNVQYADWLSGKIFGDFTHVVDAQVLKKYLFFEQFRMYEHLNWFRIKKVTSPQLLIPRITTKRERNRIDSLTISGKLKTASIIKSKFESEKLYYSLYYTDLKLYSPRALTYKLIKTILLGVACNQKKESRHLIALATKMHIKILGHLIVMLPSPFLRHSITMYSALKHDF